MSKITLNPVRYYDVNDPYTMEVDNRPIFDLSSNLDIINTRLSQLGFYKEVKADPQMEPASGFSPFTCGYIGENGLLYPIDITLSPLDLNFSSFEIVLVVEKRTSDYIVITFSSNFTIPGNFNSFLPDSVGRAIKLGPGGSLIDELAFDLYYASSNLQSVIVGKILSATTISFGGNQVSTLGNNRFVRKDTNDSTTGLTTVYRNNIENSVVSKSVVANGAGSAYSFAEIQISSNVNPGTNVLSLENSIPVFLTNKTLNLDPVTGIFTDTSFESRLNEFHVRTPTVSALTDDVTKTRTAVINSGALLDFTASYLIHSSTYSTILGETSQSLSTNLQLVPKEDTAASLLIVSSNLKTLGERLDSITGLPENLIPIVTETSTLRGISLGGFSDSGSVSGSFIGVIQDVASETSLVDTTNSLKMSEMTGSSSLLIYSKETSSALQGAANIFLLSDGYIGLYAKGGVHLSKSPVLDTEVANKAYVDLAISTITNTNEKKVTLSGTTDADPISSSFFFDVSDSLEPNTLFKLKGLTSCDVLANTSVAFKDLTSPESYIVAQAHTPASGSAKDLVNRDFMTSYVTAAISEAVAGGADPITLNGAQTVTGAKNFNVSQTFSNTVPLIITRTTAGNSKINTTNVTFLEFGVVGSSTIAAKIKLAGAISKTTDTSNVLTTKEYVDTQVATLAGTIPSYVYQDYAFWDLKAQGETGSISVNAFPDTLHRSALFSTLFEANGSGGFRNKSTKTIILKIEFNGTFHATDGYASVALKITRSGSAVAVTDAEVSSGTNSEGNTIQSDSQNPQGVLALNKMCRLADGDSFYFESVFFKASNSATTSSNPLGAFNSWGSLTVLSVQ